MQDTFLQLGNKIIVAIDGPACAGKGTIGRALAKHFQFVVLDTGLLYRAVAWQGIKNGFSEIEESHFIDLANNFDWDWIEARNMSSLRSEAVSAMTSKIATFSLLREALRPIQRQAIARQLQESGVVVDGRDIGSVIAPDARVKIFVTADLATRAKRRYQELVESQKGFSLSYDDVYEQLDKRDMRDSQRSVSPLLQADNAYLLDTSKLSIMQAVDCAVEFVKAAL